MYENWQGVNPIVPSAPWVEYKNKTLFTNWCNTPKLQGINLMDLSAPWSNYKKTLKCNKQLYYVTQTNTRG